MTWSAPFQVLRPSGPFSALDRHRAWRPSVLEGDRGVLRMWYGGHDGVVSRVLAAEQRPRDGWSRQGVAVDAGLAGASDADGTGSPSVLRTADGYLMAYEGFEGSVSRVHLATSSDGRRWRPDGPFVPPGGHHPTAAPCLVAAEGELRMYYASPGPDGRGSVFAATTSPNGRSWTGVGAGAVLRAESDEDGLSDPWVVAHEGGLLMFFLRHAAGAATVEVAMSSDGRCWARAPVPLDLARRHHDARPIGGPAALRLRGGRLRLWYAVTDDAGGCRLWTTDLTGRTP